MRASLLTRPGLTRTPARAAWVAPKHNMLHTLAHNTRQSRTDPVQFLWCKSTWFAAPRTLQDLMEALLGVFASGLAQNKPRTRFDTP